MMATLEGLDTVDERQSGGCGAVERKSSEALFWGKRLRLARVVFVALNLILGRCAKFVQTYYNLGLLH